MRSSKNKRTVSSLFDDEPLIKALYDLQDHLDAPLEKAIMEKKVRKPHKRILCKVRWQDTETMIVYRDSTFRFKDSEHVRQYMIAHSQVGPIFFYKNFEEDNWTTDWDGTDPDEKMLAETICRAQTDLEMDNILKGKDDKPTKADNSST